MILFPIAILVLTATQVPNAAIFHQDEKPVVKTETFMDTVSDEDEDEIASVQYGGLGLNKKLGE